MPLTDGAFTWNLVDDVRQLLAFHFMVNAFRAGTIVAIVAALVGWFMVLRRQTFAGHTLSIIGFPGAAGAVWLGAGAALGYFTFCVGGALVIAAVPPSGRGFRDESALIGTLQAAALAAGFLFVSLYGGVLNGIDALLFGSFLGVSDHQVVTLLILGVAAVLAVAAAGRPLLFASVDPDVAAARGVKVRLLSAAFLVMLGVAVAEVSQITGALLVFALLVVPAATAQRLTARPGVGLALAVAVAIAITWLGLAAAYFSEEPVGFWITTFGFAAYLAARVITARGLQVRGTARRGAPP